MSIVCRRAYLSTTQRGTEMKKLFTRFVSGLVAALLIIGPVFSQTYPYTNPTYLPTAVLPAVTLSAPSTSTVMVLNGIDTGSLRISGTCTSLAGTIDGSNDGTNWTTLTLYPVGGGASTKAYTAAGFWRTDTAGLTRIRANVTALTASCTFALAGTQGPAFRQPTDPCQDAAIAKASVAIAQSTATTAALVAAVSGKAVYLCSLAASAVGTNPTMTLKTGTQASTACDTATASLTGAMIPAAADGMVNMGVGHTITNGIASGQLCLTTGATTSIQGVMTYVQQ
jgi:hypothetical protein